MKWTDCAQYRSAEAMSNCRTVESFDFIRQNLSLIKKKQLGE